MLVEELLWQGFRAAMLVDASKNGYNKSNPVNMIEVYCVRQQNVKDMMT